MKMARTILKKVESAGFSEGEKVRSERKREGKGNSSVWLEH